jgi:predicted O-methyltransferase YrrM
MEAYFKLKNDMKNRIIRKLNFLRLKKNIGSYHQFSRIAPFNKIGPATLNENMEILRPYYEQYVSEVSQKDMAASLELAGFLLAICKTNNFLKLLDMGSGFSSFVFRLYAKDNPNVNVFSVDDDTSWIEKTKEFLLSHHLQTSQIYTLNSFLESGENNFDFILHDLNFVEERIKYVDILIQKASENGLILFDDVHKPDYLFNLLSKFRKQRMKVFTTKPATMDSFGRFALALLKK